MYSYQIEQAIKAAAVLHDGQVRKGLIPIPYITHLFSVMYYLSEFTDNEDVLVAALLHDTLEDTDYTVEELTNDFGPLVADIVLAVTEPDEHKGRRLSWRQKKAAYTVQLTRASDSAIMVAAADKIHNFRTLIEDYHHDHSRFVQDFGTNLTERIEVYDNMAELISRRLPENHLKSDFDQVYTELHHFLQHVINNRSQPEADSA